MLAGKVALVTGAGSGIGKVSAQLLAKSGVKVAVLGRTQEELEQTVTQIEQQNGEAMPVVADVSQPETVQQALQQIVDKWGRLDIVFANAGTNGVWASLEELSPDEWDKPLNVNIRAGGTIGAVSSIGCF